MTVPGTYGPGSQGGHRHRQRRNYHLVKRYGITIDRYEEMVEEQDGVCAICGGPPRRDVSPMGDKTAKLVVDHNHSTGKVRDLLCFDCNVKLGAIEDEQFMLLARAYLRRHGYEFTSEGEPT